LVSKLKRAEKVQQSVNLFLKSVDSCLRLVLSPKTCVCCYPIYNIIEELHTKKYMYLNDASLIRVGTFLNHMQTRKWKTPLKHKWSYFLFLY